MSVTFTMPEEVVARELARYAYEHGANKGGLDKHQWAEAHWTDFGMEARIALKTTIHMLPEVARMDRFIQMFEVNRIAEEELGAAAADILTSHKPKAHRA